MEGSNPDRDSELVRCLDCGAVYGLPTDGQEAEACPECDGVGWVALSALERAANGTSS